ncbi:MAG TPA: hypothetical protein VN659_14590, partial [Pyrinomonadaceae bacterium]|nr:hypothetical protein [Pyrinomonadaceae bacterium]
MKKLTLLVLLVLPMFTVNAQPKNPRFDVTFPATASPDALDGRLLLLISTNNTDEPRFQISEDLTTQQVFGIDVDAWKAGETKTIDQSAFG